MKTFSIQDRSISLGCSADADGQASFCSWDALFAGITDPSVGIGYNIGPQFTRLNLAEPAIGTGYEGRYRTPDGRDTMEFYNSYLSADGKFFSRPFWFIADRNTNWIHVGIAADLFQIQDAMMQNPVLDVYPGQRLFQINNSILQWRDAKGNLTLVLFPDGSISSDGGANRWSIVGVEQGAQPAILFKINGKMIRVAGEAVITP